MRLVNTHIISSNDYKNISINDFFILRLLLDSQQMFQVGPFYISTFFQAHTEIGHHIFKNSRFMSLTSFMIFDFSSRSVLGFSWYTLSFR